MEKVMGRMEETMVGENGRGVYKGRIEGTMERI